MKREDFRLKKVKVEKNLVTIDYNISGSEKEYTEKSKSTPHPDLRVALAKFVALVSQVFGMPEENQKSITVNGIVSTVRKESEFALILASYTTESGAMVALNTPNISMDTDIWPGQEKMGEIVDEISDESFKYLFENKFSQLEMTFGEEEDNDQNQEE